MADGWKGVQQRDPATYGYDTKHPWRFQCPKPNCYMSVCADSEIDALKVQQDHTCPHWGGQTKVSWSVTKTLVQQMWDLLDEEMDGAMHDVPGTKIRARAIAECVAIFMVPFFTTADEVAQEALKRWKAKQAGNLEYETAGLAARRYDRPGLESKYEGWYKAPDGGFTSDIAQAGLPTNKKRGGGVQTASKPAHKLNEKEIEAIRFMNTSGGFSVAQLAKTYGVSEAIINSVLI